MTEEIARLKRRIRQLETEVNELKEVIADSNDVLDLPTRQQEAYDLVMEREAGLGVCELASIRNISYPAAYKLLEQLRDKGLIDEVWADKGHKKVYIKR